MALRRPTEGITMSPIPADRSTLRAEGIGRSYEGDVVLGGIHLTLTPGEPPVGVIGPSGSGKTTLVNLLMGWDRPTTGGVAFGADAPYRPRRGMKKHVKAALRGVHEEADPLVDPNQRNAKVLAAARKLARQTARDGGLDDADLLGLVGLSPSALRRIPRETSLGERQRFAIALALVTDPDVLILDEPSTALDPSTAAEVLGAVTEYVMGRGTAVLIVSHNLTVIDALTSDVIALYEGEQIARGTLDHILDHPEHGYLAELAAIRAAEATIGRPDVHPESGRPPSSPVIRREDLFGG
jgi:ABC-type glutathione transport system ATPase component